MEAEIKERKEELARIERVASIEKKVLNLCVGESLKVDKLDLLTLGNLRTRLTRIKENYGRVFKSEVNGSSMTITRYEDEEVR
jgi:hypothetical protein